MAPLLLQTARPVIAHSSPEDQIVDEGRTLIYEGHDEPKSKQTPDPKTVDQPLISPSGNLTQNGLFYEAAEAFRNGERPPERVRVYEKVRQGIWVYTGLFHLLDAWMERSGEREVCKFKLRLVDEADQPDLPDRTDLVHNRVIPTAVKVAVWKRDQQRCVKCGSTDNLHFDHILPYSKGGSSLLVENIQLLCARHNLQKHDRIE